MSFFGEKPDFDFSLSSTLARNWTVVAARGVFGIIIGLIAFLFPGPTLLSLVGLFAVFLIIDGILGIVAAVRAANKNQRWGFLTFEGIVGIVAGIFAMAMPGLTVLVFVGLLAAWALVSGVLELRAAFNLATDHGRWWLALGGIISIVFGILLIAARSLGGGLGGRRLCDVFRGMPSRARLQAACAKTRLRSLTRKGIPERAGEPPISGAIKRCGSTSTATRRRARAARRQAMRAKTLGQLWEFGRGTIAFSL